MAAARIYTPDEHAHGETPLARPTPGPYDNSSHPTRWLAPHQRGASGRSSSPIAWMLVGLAIGLGIIGGIVMVAVGPITEAIEKRMDPAHQGFVGREAEPVNLEGLPVLAVYHDVSGVCRERAMLPGTNPVMNREPAVDRTRCSAAPYFPSGQRVRVLDVVSLRQASVDDRAAQVSIPSDPIAPIVWVAVAGLRRVD